MADHAHDDAHEHGHGSLRSYVGGFLLSVVLTAIPFWLVMTRALADTGLTIAIVIACAVAQIVVHVVAFLHVDTRSEGGWTLMTFLFTAVIVVITIGGSVWVMYHLNVNMMPMEGMPS